jgi:hypothetical protein
MLKLRLLLPIILALVFASPSFARDGFHGGGFHGGGFHGGGFHGRAFFGFGGFGFGGFGPYYGYAPYAYGGYAYPSYPYPYPAPYPDASIYTPQSATPPPLPPQGSAGQAAENVWYYCPPSKSYYPYVTTCSVAWKHVPTTPPSERSPS